MANKIGIRFPFTNERDGNFFDLTVTPEEEIKSNLIHLLTTKKGSRFKLPNFGTNIHLYLFEHLDGETIGQIEEEIKTTVQNFLPNIKINNVNVEDTKNTGNHDFDKHGVKIDVDYQILNKEFNSISDSVSITL